VHNIKRALKGQFTEKISSFSSSSHKNIVLFGNYRELFIISVNPFIEWNESFVNISFCVEESHSCVMTRV